MTTKTIHGLSTRSELYLESVVKMLAFGQEQGLSFNAALTLAQLHPAYPIVAPEQRMEAVRAFQAGERILHPSHKRADKTQRFNISSVAGKGRRLFLPTDQ